MQYAALSMSVSKCIASSLYVDCGIRGSLDEKCFKIFRKYLCKISVIYKDFVRIPQLLMRPKSLF